MLSQEYKVTKMLLLRMAVVTVSPEEIALKGKPLARTPRFRTGHKDWKLEQPYRNVQVTLSEPEYELLTRAAAGNRMPRGPFLARQVEKLLAEPDLKQMVDDATYLDIDSKASELIAQAKQPRNER